METWRGASSKVADNQGVQTCPTRKTKAVLGWARLSLKHQVIFRLPCLIQVFELVFGAGLYRTIEGILKGFASLFLIAKVFVGHT